jgi:hypothetical protein
VFKDGSEGDFFLSIVVPFFFCIVKLYSYTFCESAIGELMEAYTYDAESTEVSKQWQRKVARHELASFYLLFMSQSSTPTLLAF